MQRLRSVPWLVQSEAEAAREQAEARLLEAERAARRKHDELDSRAARLEAQLHQQGLDMDSYRRRSEAEASRLQQLLDMAEKTQRYLSSTCSCRKLFLDCCWETTVSFCCEMQASTSPRASEPSVLGREALDIHTLI